MSTSEIAYRDQLEYSIDSRSLSIKYFPRRMHIQVRAICCFLIFCLSLGAKSADQPTWTMAIAERGVTVWYRHQLGRSLPEFRGEGQIRGDLFHAIAVILDNERSPEWVPNCKESREIRRIDDVTALVYSVSDSPWPVRDRDTVVRVVVQTIEPDYTYRIFMQALPDHLPRVEGRIRIPYSRIYFLLQRIHPDKIKVEYGLDVDPGGALPKWMVRWTARNILIDTIRGLETQIASTREYYQPGIKAIKSE